MASSSRSTYWPAITFFAAILCLIIALPTGWKTYPWNILKQELHLGLDLAGGTQLDFRVSEDEIKAREKQVQEEIIALQEKGQSSELVSKQFELQNIQLQHKNLVEAIRTVLERRINSLGVSEATITPSYFGNEKHLLVECPGIIDVNRCIQTVGKTIQLEFKEQLTVPPPNYANTVRAKAEAIYQAVTRGTGSLQVYGQDLSSTLGVSYTDSSPIFLSQLPKGLESLANRTTKDPVAKNNVTIQTTAQDAEGQMQVREIEGIYLTKILQDRQPVAHALLNPEDALQEITKTLPGSVRESKKIVDLETVPAEIATLLTTMQIGTQKAVSFGPDSAGIVYLAGRTEGKEQMSASHILVQYKGAQAAAPSVTRTKKEAETLITDIKNQLNKGADFNTLARTLSDGESKDAAGSLGVINKGMITDSFDAAAFALQKNEVSDIVETPYGFHIIRADVPASTTNTKVSYDLLRIKGDEAKAQELSDQIEKGLITRTEDQIVIQGLFFSLEPTGWKDTALNGQRFRSAAVSFDPVTNIPVVQIQFDEEGSKLFQELTKNNIGKPIAIFVGGEMVSAPTVNGEIIGGNAVITGSRTIKEAQDLAQNLNTGAIPAPIYLAGQTTIEATLGASALYQSVYAAAIGLLILCFFLIVIYRLLGVLASAALIFYVVLLIAAMKLPIGLISNDYIVLTLAGIAGMILSMGMAVDANVLAFERIKEELRKGKLYRTAVETGFQKAWPSVRDGNTSTLITCAILFMVGTSIIRGFAVTLSIGIFISLFTSIVVTRWLCRKIAASPLAERLELFGVSKTEKKE